MTARRLVYAGSKREGRASKRGEGSIQKVSFGAAYWTLFKD